MSRVIRVGADDGCLVCGKPILDNQRRVKHHQYDENWNLVATGYIHNTCLPGLVQGAQKEAK